MTGVDKDFNQTLEKAGRVADFIELGHLMCVDALDREESCGAHARLEYLAESGDAMRDDENFGYVAAWEFNDENPLFIKSNLILSLLNQHTGTINEFYITYLAPKKYASQMAVCHYTCPISTVTLLFLKCSIS